MIGLDIVIRNSTAARSSAISSTPAMSATVAANSLRATSTLRPSTPTPLQLQLSCLQPAQLLPPLNRRRVRGSATPTATSATHARRATFFGNSAQLPRSNPDLRATASTSGISAQIPQPPPLRRPPLYPPHNLCSHRRASLSYRQHQLCNRRKIHVGRSSVLVWDRHY